MAKKQTFIIMVKAPSDQDFFRVGCKRAETALRYLKGWKQQALDKGLKSLYNVFFEEGATYSIVATPDGYHKTETVLSGKMCDL